MGICLKNPFIISHVKLLNITSTGIAFLCHNNCHKFV